MFGRQRLTLLMLPVALVSGCASVTPTSDSALCDGTRQARADLAAALADDPNDRAVIAGADLIDKLDAGCAK